MYYVLLAPSADREEVLARLTSEGIGAVFHYVPLHDSPAGRARRNSMAFRLGHQRRGFPA